MCVVIFVYALKVYSNGINAVKGPFPRDGAVVNAQWFDLQYRKYLSSNIVHSVLGSRQVIYFFMFIIYQLKEREKVSILTPSKGNQAGIIKRRSMISVTLASLDDDSD